MDSGLTSKARRSRAETDCASCVSPAINKQLAVNSEIDLNTQMIRDLLRQELKREVSNRPGYRRDDEIIVFEVIAEPFTMENGLLTQTLKIRRNVVMDRYEGLIRQMFGNM